MLQFLLGSDLIGYLVAGVAALVSVLFAYLRGRSTGHKKGRIEQAQHSLEISERMRRANASVDRSRDGLVDRLRDGGF